MEWKPEGERRAGESGWGSRALWPSAPGWEDWLWAEADEAEVAGLGEEFPLLEGEFGAEAAADGDAAGAGAEVGAVGGCLELGKGAGVGREELVGLVAGDGDEAVEVELEARGVGAVEEDGGGGVLGLDDAGEGADGGLAFEEVVELVGLAEEDEPKADGGGGGPGEAAVLGPGGGPSADGDGAEGKDGENVGEEFGAGEGEDEEGDEGGAGEEEPWGGEGAGLLFAAEPGDDFWEEDGPGEQSAEEDEDEEVEGPGAAMLVGDDAADEFVADEEVEELGVFPGDDGEPAQGDGEGEGAAQGPWDGGFLAAAAHAPLPDEGAGDGDDEGHGAFGEESQADGDEKGGDPSGGGVGGPAGEGGDGGHDPEGHEHVGGEGAAEGEELEGGAEDDDGPEGGEASEPKAGGEVEEGEGAKAGEDAGEAGGEFVEAKEAEAGGGGPIDERGFLGVGEAVEGGHEPVAGGQHFAGHFGVAAFVGLNEAAGVEEEERRGGQEAANPDFGASWVHGARSIPELGRGWKAE